MEAHERLLDIAYRVFFPVVIVGACVIGWNLRDTRPPPPMKWDGAAAHRQTVDIADAKGQRMSADLLSEAQRIVLYFSVSADPACQEFTPKLTDFHQKNGGGKNFQLLHLTSGKVGEEGEKNGGQDSEEKDAAPSVDEAPWWIVRDNSGTAREIREAYPGKTVPRLVLLDGSGRVLTDSTQGGVESVLKAISEGQ
jgi:hypothetical protein